MMADIKAKFQYNDTEVSIAFPCSESELRTKLAKLHAPDDTAELFLAKVEYPTEFAVMENTFVNLDEMNYLAKRLDSFFGNEELQFYEAMRLEGFTSLKDLINLSFNLDKYTLIQNVGDMQKVGIEYTLNTQGGMPADDTDNPKYAEIGRKLLQSGEGIFTEHGLFFKDKSHPFEELYDGQVFPAYVYDSGVLVIAEAKYKDKAEYLYLPCESLAIDKAFRRLGADGEDSCEISLTDFTTNNPAWENRMKDLCRTEGIYEVNRLAEAVNCADMDLDKLTATAEYADVDSTKDLIALAEHIGDFVFIKDAEDYETVGRYFAETDPKYDLNLELEDFFDFNGFGEYLAEANGGEFISSGFVCMKDGAELSEILDSDEDMTMGGM